MIKRILFVFAALFVFSFLAAAQQQYPATFLWRITGNKITAPSYLYGTMHLQDRRLFFFGDSLYNAIEKTQGFAMEINPDEMVDSLIQFFKREDTSSFLKKMMDKAAFKKISGPLAKRLKTPADKITVQQLSNEKNKWLYSAKRKDDMPVAMDLYLYNIARKMGKETGGIEDVGDQLNLLNDFSLMELDAFVNNDTVMRENYLEHLKKIYLTNDLTAINNIYVNSADMKGFKDAMLDKRNIKMAVRIDSIARLRSNFFAVGAAHLPGETGLITLLQKAGFTVEPVYSSANVSPESYKVKSKELKWQPVTDNNGIVTVQMPGQPMDLPTSPEMPMKMYIDMGEMKFYAVGVTAVNEEEAKSDTFFNKLIRNYRQKEMEVLEVKKVEYNGLKGIEMIALQNNENYFRYRVVLNGSTMALILFGSQNKNVIYEDIAEKYFSTLQFNTNTVSAQKKWQVFIHEKNAFSVEFPGKALTDIEKDDAGKLADKYYYSDLAGDSYFTVTVRDIEPGYYFENDSTYFEEYKTNIDNITQSGLKEFSVKKFKGYPACYFSAVQKQDGHEYVLSGYLVRRGGRIYQPMIVAPKMKTDFPEFTQFFRSFEFLPFKETGWHKTQLETGAFTTSAPAAIKLVQPKDSIQALSEADFKKYRATDNNAAITYTVEATPFSPYYWNSSDTAFLRKKAESFSGWRDSIISFSISTNPILSALIIIKLPETDTYKKMKVFLNGDTLYTLYSFQPEALLSNKYFNAFFDSVQLQQQYPVTVFTNKAAQLLAALQSPDSTTAVDALGVLDDVVFTKSELPLLLKALGKKYKNYNEYKTVNENIADIIIELNDERVIDYAINRYGIVNDTAADIKMPLLNILAGLKTAPAFTALKKMLLSQPPVTGNAYTLNRSLADTLQMAKDFFPEVCNLYADTVIGADIIDIAVLMLDSNITAPKNILQNENGLLALAKKQLHELTRDSESYISHNNRVIELLRYFNSKESNALLQQFAALKTIWVKSNAVIALIKNNQALLAAHFLAFAKDKGWRTYFYDDLKKLNKTALFPKEYYSQAKFAESYLYNFLSDEYEMELEKMQFIKTVTATVAGKQQKYFIYKVMNSDAEIKTWQLAFCGPFGTNAAVAEIDAELLDIYLDDENDFNGAEVDKRFKEFIASKSTTVEGLKK